MKKLFAVLVPLIVLTLVFAPPALCRKNVIKIGINAPMTGDIPKVGEGTKFAGQMWLEDIKKAGGLKVGDKVMGLARTNWVQQIRDKAESFIRLPSKVDLAQAAMLKVNVATAHLMLTTNVPLSKGDWVIQDAANSGVGVNLIRLAHADGIRTVNVVRRTELIEPLMKLGADVVVVDAPDLADRVAKETGGANIKLGIDAVAGSAIGRLTNCVGEGGTVVNYGLLSGEDCRVNAFNFVFRDIKLVGFWLAKVMRELSSAEIQKMYERLGARLLDGTIHVDIEASYPLEHVSDAMAHAKRESRGGKVQLRPNG